jgi:hypothetical protein
MLLKPLTTSGRVLGATFALTQGLILLPGAGAARAASFVRGDTNETGKLEITDAILTLQYLFQGKGDAVRCLDAADTDDDGAVGLPDAILGLTYLFRAGREPPGPFPACGTDQSADELDCAANGACATESITFFDITLEADGVFWVVDRSGTFAGNGALGLAKQQIVATMESLNDSTWFGVLFVDKGVLKFPAGDHPAQANDEMRASGVAFVQGVAGGAGSCDIAGLLESLQFAERTGTHGSVIFYVGNGGGTCPGWNGEAAYLEEMRRSFKEANQGLAQLHTVGIGPLGPVSEQHLRDLAEQNGGQLHLVPLR